MKSQSVADLPALLESLVPLIREAGAVIMDIYATDFDVTKKGDDSDRKSTRLNSSHSQQSRMPSSA